MNTIAYTMYTEDGKTHNNDIHEFECVELHSVFASTETADTVIVYCYLIVSYFLKILFHIFFWNDKMM